MEKIIKKLSLGENATEAEILAAIDALQTANAVYKAAEKKAADASEKGVKTRMQKAADDFFTNNKSAKKVFVTDNGKHTFAFAKENDARNHDKNYQTFTPKV